MIDLYIDMDGVLFNFNKGAFKAHNREYVEDAGSSLEKEWNISKKEFWEIIDKYGQQFWVNLEEYEWFDELIDLCPDFNIATSPSLSHHAASGKVLALQKRFGKYFRRYNISPEKWKLGFPGNILIDDLESNCEKFEERGGTAILFPQYWNKNRYLVDNRMEYVKEQLEKLEAVNA